MYEVVKKQPNIDTSMRIHLTVPMDFFVLLKETKVLRNIDTLFVELFEKYMTENGYIIAVDEEIDE